MYDQWRRIHLAWYRLVAYKRSVRSWLSIPENKALAESSGWIDEIVREGSPSDLPQHTAQAVMQIDDDTDKRFRARFQAERKAQNA